MRSTPMPGRAMTRSRRPMRSIMSPVTNVAPDTIITSAFAASIGQSLRSPTTLVEMQARLSSTAIASGRDALPVHTNACDIDVSPLHLYTRRAQVARSFCYHATDIRRHANHLEALTYSLGSGLAVAAKNARRDVMLARAGLDAFQRLHKCWFGSVAARRQADLSMQIVRSDKGDIDSVHGENSIQIVQRRRALDLDNHQRFIVGCAPILRPIGDAKTIGAKGSADAARATRRIFGELHGALRLFARIDHRHHNAPRASIQRPLEPFDPVGGNTHDGGAGPSINDSRHYIGHESGIMRAMLHVYDEPVKAESRHNASRGDAGKAQPGSQSRFASFKLFFHLVCSHHLFTFLLSLR